MDLSGSSSGRQGTLIPALVCAALSVGLMRSGLFSFFFLVPLGFSAAAFNRPWLSFVSAALFNAAVSTAMGLRYGAGLAGAGLDSFYYTAMTLGFTWICSGFYQPSAVRTAYRFIAASVAGALAFLFLAYAARDSGLGDMLRRQAELLSSAYIASSGADAVRRSVLERQLTPENILAFMRAIALRGVALGTCFFLFFISRQISLSLSRFILRRRPAGLAGLDSFHAPRHTIWALSLSLAGILLAKMAGAEIPEIAAWNILVICAILFLAQGGGVALYNLRNRAIAPFGRILINILIIAAIFSPGINAIALALLVLLGIAENWLPLRAPVEQGPASTPGP